MNQTQDYSVGAIQRATTEAFAANRRSILIFLAVFVPLAGLGNWLDQDNIQTGMSFYNGPVGLVVLVLSVIGQFLLFQRMLFGEEHGLEFSSRMAAFVGLGILTFLGTSLASLLLIIPGLFVGARWLMSPAIFVAEGRGVADAMSESWQRTRGKTVNVAITLFLVVIVFMILGAVLNGVLLGAFGFAGGGIGIVRYFVDALASEFFSVVLIAMSVGTYNLLTNRTDELSDVFG